ncbi:MAG: lycopene cyclase domain-containing protein [Bacteroidia bacterium]|nr:lycopene cyclase domain-containing protein [Bacteroidia bacterium]MCX7763635.1 lycopene cyclase domain-containing protein [Bacteroidia bacterium]MDW8056729.1 lycopene cyclase domain-containing protein [Bacteroidia bacterium]
MTYGEFLLWFIGLPIGGLIFWSWGKKPLPPLLARPFFFTASFLAIVAVAYTTPWDNYLVFKGVWTYPSDRVWGIRLGWVPLEEYIFFVLQTILTLLWIWGLSARITPDVSTRLPRWMEWAGGAAFFFLAGGAWAALKWGPSHWNYLALIIGWSFPVIGGQWALGGRGFWAYRRLLLIGIIFPTLYLWGADTFAIRSGIWHISEKHSLGRYLPGGLPVEEAVFFLVTNTLIGFGFILVHRLRVSFMPLGKRRI